MRWQCEFGRIWPHLEEFYCVRAGNESTSCWCHQAGGLTRAEGEDRIDFLAKVRNLALEPLWRARYGGNGSAPVTGEGFRADRVVFVNDVYFCARDVVRPAAFPPI